MKRESKYSNNLKYNRIIYLIILYVFKNLIYLRINLIIFINKYAIE